MGGIFEIVPVIGGVEREYDPSVVSSVRSPY